MLKLKFPEIDEEIEGIEHLYTPERRLFAAMIARAISDLGSKDLMERSDAKEWFLSPHRYHLKLSYTSCCAGLDIDPNALLDILKDKGYFNVSNIWTRSDLYKQNGIKRFKAAKKYKKVVSLAFKK